MFFSTDLLAQRGKFNLIWLAATRDSQTAVKKYKKKLLALNLGSVCKELSKMIPVQGREKSFSLRTSAILTHGVLITFRIQADAMRLRLLNLRENSRSVQTLDKIDVDLSRLNANKIQLTTETVQLDFGDIAAGIEEDPFALDDEEAEARRKAVTMTEVDVPSRMSEDWSIQDEFPRIEEQQQTADPFGDPLNPLDLGMERTIETGELGLNDTEMPPPVKPRVGSNIRIEETPDVPEDSRPRRISPPVLELNPQDQSQAEKNQGKEIQGPAAQVPEIRVETLEEYDRRPQPLQVDVGDVNVQELPAAEDGVIIQDPAPVGSPSQLSLESLEPPRKKQRRRRFVFYDPNTQIPSDTLKAQFTDFDDTQRAKTNAEDSVNIRSLKLSKEPDMTKSGIKLGDMASKLWSKSLTGVNASNEANFDWPNESDVGEPLVALPALDTDLEQPLVADEQPSELRERDGSHLMVPDPNLSNDEAQANSRRSRSFVRNSLTAANPDLHSTLQQGEGDVAGPVAMPLIQEELPEDNVIFGLDQLNPTTFTLSPAPRNQEDFEAGHKRSITPESSLPNESQVVTSTMEDIRAVLGERKTGSFDNLVKPDMRRRDVSRMILNLLVANKRKDLILEQDDDGSITIELP